LHGRDRKRINILVGKPERQRQLVRPRHRWRMYLAHDRDRWHTIFIFWFENWMGRDHLEDLGVDER
jgi:hypothetical protein